VVYTNSSENLEDEWYSINRVTSSQERKKAAVAKIAAVEHELSAGEP
jgi:hypothetical protein